MRKFIPFIYAFVVCSSCCAQSNFDEFVKKFNYLSLPINDVLTLPDTDTLNGKLTNDILIREQKTKPRYVDKEQNLQSIKQYYGLYPEKPFAYGYKGDQLRFNSRIIPIGRVNLNQDYVSLLIKVVDYETTFFDLWNFSENGEALSVVCLFWGMRDAGPRNETVTFTVVSSKILKNGDIVWKENNDGLKTSRKYRLNNGGFFQIFQEDQTGNVEY